MQDTQEGKYSRAPVHALDADGGAIVVGGQRSLAGPRVGAGDCAEEQREEQAEKVSHDGRDVCSRSLIGSRRGTGHVAAVRRVHFLPLRRCRPFFFLSPVFFFLLCVFSFGDRRGPSKGMLGGQK